MTSLRFAERMSGWISFSQRSYNQAVTDGRRSGTRCSQELEIEIDDLERFVADPHHTARATGTVSCEQLGGYLSVAPARASTCSSMTAGSHTSGCSIACSCATAPGAN